MPTNSAFWTKMATPQSHSALRIPRHLAIWFTMRRCDNSTLPCTRTFKNIDQTVKYDLFCSVTLLTQRRLVCLIECGWRGKYNARKAGESRNGRDKGRSRRHEFAAGAHAAAFSSGSVTLRIARPARYSSDTVTLKAPAAAWRRQRSDCVRSVCGSGRVS